MTISALLVRLFILRRKVIMNKKLEQWKNYGKIAVILGSGLNECINDFMDIEGEISYK